METLTNAITGKQNVALTILHGLERSRLLLRCSFALLAKQPSYKFYHILDQDHLVKRVQHEASLMPFRELGPEGAQTRLVICSLVNSLKFAQAAHRAKGEQVVLIFDVSSLEALEETLLDLAGRKAALNLLANLTKPFAPSSIVIACNGPLDGLEPELGHSFPITLTNSPHQAGTFASIITSGPGGAPMTFGGPNAPKRAKRRQEKAKRLDVGAILESLSGHVSSGGVVVLFPTYAKMVEYHDAWQKAGVFKRSGLPYGREVQASEGEMVKKSKRGLQELVAKDRSIYLSSIKGQLDEDLAEMVLGRVRLVLWVGLPYSTLNDSWKARIKEHNKEFQKIQKKGSSSSKAGLLSGNQLYKYRAIDLMNGTIKSCLLNRFRSESCDFFLLDQELGNDRDKLAKELGDMQVETFQEAFARYKLVRMAQPSNLAKESNRCVIQ